MNLAGCIFPLFKMSTTETTISIRVGKKKVIREPNGPLYPSLSSCAKIVNDPFWEYLFEESANRRFPKAKMSFTGDSICYQKGTSSEKKLVVGPPEEVDGAKVKELIAFFNSTGIYSPEQEEENRAAYANTGVADNWGSIPKRTREDLISIYVKKYATENKLSPEHTSSFNNAIALGVGAGWITSDDIEVYEEGGAPRIASIDGVEFDPALDIYDVAVEKKKIPKLPTKQPAASKKARKTALDQWEERMQEMLSRGRGMRPQRDILRIIASERLQSDTTTEDAYLS